MINKDMMAIVKDNIVEEVNENVSNKNHIVDTRMDHLFQRLNKLNATKCQSQDKPIDGIDTINSNSTGKASTDPVSQIETV